MSPDPFSTDALPIAYRADLDQLTGRWLRSVTEDERHAGYEALRLAARHYRCGYWLIDSRRRTSRSLNGPQWVTTRFLPQVQRELETPLCAGFLVLPSYLSSLPPAQQAAAPGSAVQFARFLEEDAANAWLAARQSEG